MFCPYCGFDESKVLESRFNSEKNNIRRRRECESCSKRFTTYEKIEIAPVFVIKRNGSKQEFSRQKLINSLMSACKKCDIRQEFFEEISDRLELEFSMNSKKEIQSSFIAEKILSHLESVCPVGHIRYLSVYNKFSTLDEVQSALSDTIKANASLV